MRDVEAVRGRLQLCVVWTLRLFEALRRQHTFAIDRRCAACHPSLATINASPIAFCTGSTSSSSLGETSQSALGATSSASSIFAASCSCSPKTIHTSCSYRLAKSTRPATASSQTGLKLSFSEPVRPFRIPRAKATVKGKIRTDKVAGGNASFVCVAHGRSDLAQLDASFASELEGDGHLLDVEAAINDIRFGKQFEGSESESGDFAGEVGQKTILSRFGNCRRPARELKVITEWEAEQQRTLSPA